MQYQPNPEAITSRYTYMHLNKNNNSKNWNMGIKNSVQKIVCKTKNSNYKSYKRFFNAQKQLKRKLIKQNKHLAKNFKIIGIINSFNDENNILYTLLRKLKVRCAYLTPHLLCSPRKKEYFDNESLNYIILNRILKKLKDEHITHIIINISLDQIEVLQKIKFSHCIINDLNIASPKDITFINSITKNTLGPIVLCSDDKYFKKIRKRSNFITLGNNGNYRVSKNFRRSSYTIVNFEHQYNKYSLYTDTVNPYLIKTYLLSMITASLLGYDLLDVIRILNKVFHKKKIK